MGKGLTYVDSWNALASRGIGRIPEGTVVDTTISPFAMWTQQPVSLTDDPKATSYCYDTVAFCFANVYGPKGAILDSALLPRSDTPLPERIAAHKPLGLDDWRVPSVSELIYLTRGATNAKQPLPTWAVSQGLQQFPSRTITSHLAGTDRTQTVVGPFLARPQTGPGILQSSDASQSGLDFFAQAQGQNQDGGQLLLVRDAPVTKLCTDWCGKQPTAIEVGVAHRPSFPHPATAPPERAGKPRTAPAEQAEQVAPGAALGQPTTYNQPTTCTSGPTYTVSPGADAVRVTATGGAGGAGKLESKTDGQPGGRGGSVTTVIPALPGSTLRVQVGGAGGDTVAGVAGGGAGGGTVPASGIDAKPGSHTGGGGGASGVASDAACSLWLVVAGGGGGGGSGWSSGGTTMNGSWNGGRGGDGCPLPNTAAVGCTAATSGRDAYPNHKLGTAGGAPPGNTGGHSRDGNNEVGGDGST